MKKYIKILPIISLFMLGIIVSCDKIPEDEYLINGGITPPEPGDSTAQYVLLEDFTGQGCINCPEAAAVINEILSVYGNRVIVLAEHVGKDVNPQMGSDDPRLLSNVAANYFAGFGGNAQTGLPQGVVQRVKVRSNYLIGRSAWATNVAAQLANKPPLTLALNVTDDMIISVDFKMLKDYQDAINLIVLITQDSIIAPQTTTAGHIDNYVHNHVLRDAITPTSNNLSNGQWLTPGPISKGHENTITFPQYSFPDNTYVKEHCAVVAIAVNTVTNEVLQCASYHLH